MGAQVLFYPSIVQRFSMCRFPPSSDQEGEGPARTLSFPPTTGSFHGCGTTTEMAPLSGLTTPASPASPVSPTSPASPAESPNSPTAVELFDDESERRPVASRVMTRPAALSEVLCSSKLVEVPHLRVRPPPSRLRSFRLINMHGWQRR